MAINPNNIFTQAAGAMAGAAFWGIAYPLDTLKSMVQASSSASHISLRTMYKAAVKVGGIGGLYKVWQ